MGELLHECAGGQFAEARVPRLNALCGECSRVRPEAFLWGAAAAEQVCVYATPTRSSAGVGFKQLTCNGQEKKNLLYFLLSQLPCYCPGTVPTQASTRMVHTAEAVISASGHEGEPKALYVRMRFIAQGCCIVPLFTQFSRSSHVTCLPCLAAPKSIVDPSSMRAMYVSIGRPVPGRNVTHVESNCMFFVHTVHMVGTVHRACV